jgi:hypothetical protein
MNKTKDSDGRAEPKIFFIPNGKGKTIEQVIKDKKNSVIRYLESIPEQEIPQHDWSSIKEEALEKGRVRPAKLALDGWDYRKVRAISRYGDKEMVDAVRVEIPFTGDAAAFNWCIEEEPNGIPVNWGLAENAKAIWVFQEILELEDGDNIVESAQQAGEIIASIMRVLGIMQAKADAWNDSIASLVEENLQKRLREAEAKKAFMEKFRQTVEAFLLTSDKNP